MKKCTKCGYEGESNFCPECGGQMEEIVEVTEQVEEKSTPEKKTKDKKTIIIIILAVAVIALAGMVLLNMGSSSGNDWIEEEDVSLAENNGKELPGGTYVVGEDIPAGKYMLMYTTTMSEDDYWTNDYLWITYAGSEGQDETLGGTKFDDRFGPVEYGDAVDGESFYATFNNGDTIRVDSEYGDWTY